MHCAQQSTMASMMKCCNQRSIMQITAPGNLLISLAAYRVVCGMVIQCQVHLPSSHALTHISFASKPEHKQTRNAARFMVTSMHYQSERPARTCTACQPGIAGMPGQQFCRELF
jgi:hypothetical protein